jgi:putative membrane-bound dehydrogenase-like protein
MMKHLSNLRTSRLVHVLFVVMVWFNGFALAQTQTDLKQNFADELPRTPAMEPAQALAAIQIKDGYRLELAAAEPLVRDPVAMSFDENGRMFVVEMCDYSEQDKEFLGNVRLLEDADNDGRYEKSTLFAHHLSWPTGAICYDGGVFIAAAPDIWFCKDTDGDGQADIQTKVFTGFGRQNVQGLLNSFCWGIDNRIYCQTSSSGASVLTLSHPDRQPLVLNGRDFSFDPSTLELRPESGGGQHGMSFDDWGRRFSCHNSDHLQLHLYADRYAGKTDIALPASRQSIAADGPQASVYRISPVEPWRTVRTRLRVTNQVPGLVEGGGRSSGYFTSATGVTIYRGNAFHEDMLGMAFVGDVGSNIVHRKKLSPKGTSMVGERIDVESEFIASSDIWFRPVQFANAPDGSLYIADLYREVIEHPKSLPEEIKKHLDLTSGRDRGRVYRVVPMDFKRPPNPKMRDASIAELIATLEHSNGWHRDTASRLLYERFCVNWIDSPISKSSLYAAIKELKNLVMRSTSPKARLHALGVLASLGAGQGGAEIALNDSHPRVREWAVRFCESETATPDTQAKLLLLANDPDPNVRLQLGLSLTHLGLPQKARLQIAIGLVASSNDDKFLTASSLNAIGSNASAAIEFLAVGLGAGQGMQQIVDNPKSNGEGQGGHLMAAWQSIAALAGTNAKPEELQKLDERIGSTTISQAKRSLCIGLMSGLRTRYSDATARAAATDAMPNLRSEATKLVMESRSRCQDNNSPIDQKLQAIALLRWEQLDDDIPMLANLMDQYLPQPIQEAAMRALMQYQSAEVAQKILNIWPSLSPRMRLSASDVILSRSSWIEAMLERAGQGGFALTDLDPSRLANLRNHKNAAIQQKIATIMKSSGFGNRQEVVDRYQAALTLAGDKSRGKQIFAKSCAACHRLEGVGYELAPNIAAYKFRGAEAILQNVLEPNREVNPQYVTYTVITNDERIVTGMISNESETSVTLLRGENSSEVVPRANISEMKSSKMSLMPEGLESQIDLQSMSDLIAYVLSLP